METLHPLQSDQDLTEYFKLFKSRDVVPLICYACNTYFERKKMLIQKTIRKKHRIFCTTHCARLTRDTENKSSYKVLSGQCAECLALVTRIKSQLLRSKSGHMFCSKSCAITYNNKHKTTGTRRSKLESYLEEQIRLIFPSLQLLCNDKTAIGSELDFYFPDLKFAIELNGILHYEPIYGETKFEQIQSNDQQKFSSCRSSNIELCIIDSSSCKNLTQSQKCKYWDIVFNLLTRILPRLSSLSSS